MRNKNQQEKFKNQPAYILKVPYYFGYFLDMQFLHENLVLQGFWKQMSGAIFCVKLFSGQPYY